MMNTTSLTLLLMLTAGEGDVRRLGHDSYKIRSAAEARLSRKVDSCIYSILAGERHADPEVRARCKVMADGYYRRHAAAIAEHYKPGSRWPRIDMGQCNVWPQEPTAEQSLNWHMAFDLADDWGLPNNWTYQYELKRRANRLLREVTRRRLVMLIANREPFADWLRQQIDFERRLQGQDDRVTW